MNKVRFWPFGAIIVAAIALVAGVGTALFFKYQRTAQASSLPNAARIERVTGQVGVNQSGGNNNESQWVEATANTPVSVGDRIYTKENSRAVLAFTSRNFATVEANTSLDVLDLSNNRTQVALREGSALFDVGSLPSGSLFEVATPCGAIDLRQPGIYRIDINSDGNATATAFSGEAQVVGQQGAGQIQKGESLVVPCNGNGVSSISKVEPDQAGAYIDNYYRSRYPKRYDGRYRSYYTYLEDPYYYDPERLYQSYNYVSDDIPGVYDLDDYGDWRYVNDYGYVWQPRVYSGWAPYQSGYWSMDYPYGLTWVSSEPWGYAPYHYGRWANVSNEWFWVPETTTSYPTYSPALVAFIPFNNSSAAWVALGPGDPYANRYYDQYWQPSYVYPSNVVVDRVVNINVPGAVNVVPVQDFTQVIDPGIITHVDPQTITRVRPVLDPLTVAQLRTAAFETRKARGRIDISRQVEQRIDNTAVIASNAPPTRFRRDLARELNVQQLGDKAKKQRLQIKDQRGAVATANAPQTNIASEQQRERQMLELARQASRGDRNARQQMQELRRQQSEPRSVERANVAAGARVGQPVGGPGQRQLMRQQQQTQRDAARQQMITTQQERKQQRAAPRAAARPQLINSQPERQRAAARQQLINSQPQRQQQQMQREQRRQERAQRSAPQPQVLRPQPQQQRRQERPPQAQRQAAPRMIAPQQPQVRVQSNRGQERHAASAAAPQQQQVRPQPPPQAQKQPKGGGPPASAGQKGGGKKKP